MIVGITGSIACGKSIVLSYLKLKGYKVLSLDDICHDLLDEKSVNEEVKNALGIKHLGNASRKEIGDIVFNDENKLKLLDDILHPLAIKKMELEIKIARAVKGHLFIEVPLLYETKMNKYFDKVWFIYANQETQIKRLMERNNMTLDEAMNRINKQISVDKKMQMAILYGDYVIDNSGDLVYTYNRIDSFLEEM